jgi:hypothetical protein
MNLESLEKLVADQVEAVKLPDDQTVFIQPMMAEDDIALSEWFASRGYGKEGDDKPVSSEDLVAYYAFVLSKCIVEPRPKENRYVKTIDSDRGRELIAKIEGRRFTHLAKAALRKSGISLDVDAVAKKNSPPQSDLLAGSAFSGASPAAPSNSGDSLPPKHGNSGSSSTVSATEKTAQTAGSTLS